MGWKRSLICLVSIGLVLVVVVSLFGKAVVLLLPAKVRETGVGAGNAVDDTEERPVIVSAVLLAMAVETAVQPSGHTPGEK